MIAAPIPQGLALRVSITDRCQLRCRYCMPDGGVPLCGSDGILSYEEITSLVACLREEFGLAKVRITGGEPLVRPEMERLIESMAKLDIPDLAMTTNALRLAELAPRLKRAGLGRVNISLDTLSQATFCELTGGGQLERVLDGIAAAREAGLLPIKLNTVVIRGVNEMELPELVAFGLRENCENRFIELMPIGPGAKLFDDGFVSSEAVRKSLQSHFSLRELGQAQGASARRYSVIDAEGRVGTVGFISSCSTPFCGDCSRLRITADGRLIGCLARDGGVSIRDHLRAGDKKSVILAAHQVLKGKTVNRKFEQSMAMTSIGG